MLYDGLLYAGYMAVPSTLSTQLAHQYKFNSIQVGLRYLPLGTGSIGSRWTVGELLDWNFRREARIQGLLIEKNRHQNIEHFNIERARLLVTMPIVYCASAYFLAPMTWMGNAILHFDRRPSCDTFLRWTHPLAHSIC